MTSRDIKEAIKVAISWLKLNRIYAKYRVLRGQNVSHLLISERAGRFSKIYESSVWLNDRASGALSGIGSEIKNTNNIRNELPVTLLKLGATSLLDIGCGDLTWVRQTKLPCSYVGADIVSSVIEKNRSEFSFQDKRFIVLDAVTDIIPECDVILCREILFHLSFEDIQSLITNILKSNARYLLATNDSDRKFNADIITGDYRLLNLRKSPFNFPAPIDFIPDNEVTENRYIGVWRLNDLRPVRHRQAILDA
jgi:SAM-dependent methyltransferase